LESDVVPVWSMTRWTQDADVGLMRKTDRRTDEDGVTDNTRAKYNENKNWTRKTDLWVRESDDRL